MDDELKYNPKIKRDTRDPSRRVYVKPKKIYQEKEIKNILRR